MIPLPEICMVALKQGMKSTLGRPLLIWATYLIGCPRENQAGRVPYPDDPSQNLYPCTIYAQVPKIHPGPCLVHKNTVN